MSNTPSKPGFGVSLGNYQGVEGYSNRKPYNSGSNYANGHYTGYKYQCVEYARRWMILSKNMTFESIDCAYHIWELDHVIDLQNQKLSPLIGIPNGSAVPPVSDTLLIYSRGHGVPWGHVAVITEVNIRQGYVRIAEQNDEDRYWPGNYARQIRLEKEGENYWIRDKYHAIGWMMFDGLERLEGLQ